MSMSTTCLKFPKILLWAIVLSLLPVSGCAEKEVLAPERIAPFDEWGLCQEIALPEDFFSHFDVNNIFENFDPDLFYSLENAKIYDLDRSIQASFQVPSDTHSWGMTLWMGKPDYYRYNDSDFTYSFYIQRTAKGITEAVYNGNEVSYFIRFQCTYKGLLDMNTSIACYAHEDPENNITVEEATAYFIQCLYDFSDMFKQQEAYDVSYDEVYAKHATLLIFL